MRLVIQTLIWFLCYVFFLFFIQLSLDIINFHPIRTLEGAAQHAVPVYINRYLIAPKCALALLFLEVSTFHKQVAKLYFIFGISYENCRKLKLICSIYLFVYWSWARDLHNYAKVLKSFHYKLNDIQYETWESLYAEIVNELQRQVQGR